MWDYFYPWEKYPKGKSVWKCWRYLEKPRQTLLIVLIFSFALGKIFNQNYFKLAKTC